MTLPAIIEAQNLIMAGDIAGAEHALVSIADTQGDRALVRALDDLPSKDLLAVIREYEIGRAHV